MQIPKRELEIRQELVVAPESEKVRLLLALISLVEDRRQHAILSKSEGRADAKQ